MANLNYKFSGVNKELLANEIQLLRQKSSSFRALEAAALAAGYTTIEIEMGPNLLPSNIADSTRIDSTTRKIRINANVTASWGVEGRQATVGEVIAHELGHAVVPPEYRRRGVIDPLERDDEGMWVRRQAGQVAADLGLLGPNNADYPATRIPINEIQGCTVQHPRGDGARDGVLFLDGSRGYHGLGQGAPSRSNSNSSPGSRYLANGQPSEAVPASGADNEPPVRYLSQRIGAAPNPSAPDVERSDTAFPIPQAVAPGRPATFNDRFANWIDSDGAIAPLGPRRAAPPAEDNRPLGIFSGKPMPNYPFPPPIFFPEAAAAGDEDWLLQLLAPRRRR